VVEYNIPEIVLVRDGIPYDIPHGYPGSTEKCIEDEAVGNGYFDRKKKDKIKNGKVDPRNEGPQTKINGNGSFVQENRVLHVAQFADQ